MIIPVYMYDAFRKPCGLKCREMQCKIKLTDCLGYDKEHSHSNLKDKIIAFVTH